MDKRTTLEREELDAVREVFKNADAGQQLQIIDRLPDDDAKLVSVDNTAKRLSASLPPRRFGEQILVLAEEDSAKSRGSVKEVGVFQARRPIKLRGQHVHPSQEQPTRDGHRHMDVHVNANAHATLPISRKRFRIGDSPACARNFSTSWAFR